MTLTDTQQPKDRTLPASKTPAVFVDGASGTTGLGIRERLDRQNDVTVKRMPMSTAPILPFDPLFCVNRSMAVTMRPGIATRYQPSRFPAKKRKNAVIKRLTTGLAAKRLTPVAPTTSASVKPSAVNAPMIPAAKSKALRTALRRSGEACWVK